MKILFGVVFKSFSIFLLLCLSTAVQAKGLENNPPALNVCRFGITSAHAPDGYPLNTLGVGGYLDWTADSHNALPPGVDYLRVLRLSDVDFDNTKANLPGWLAANPGSTWIVGNEPDTKYNGQDGLLPEVYADRFYEVATMIRAADPSAHIAIGTIVQPTHIRLRYLGRVWDQLVHNAGGISQASELIDIWAIHSFLLNEKPDSWGTGVPPGFENDYADAYITDDISTTYSITLFKERIINFRAWLKEKGENGKPVWITEYGSLIPPINAWWTNNQTVSDAITADYMAATFDFLLTAADSNTGLASDNHLLVQRWFWFSLNDHRYNFGGSLFDPDNDKAITQVGLRFRDYAPPAGITSDVGLSGGYSILPVLNTSEGTRVDYLVKVNISSSMNSNAPTRVRVSLYEGDTLIADPVITAPVQRCGGQQVAKVWWKNVIPGSAHSLVARIEAVDRTDPDLSNNIGALNFSEADLGYPTSQIFLPILRK